jgi:hypothetical protein
MWFARGDDWDKSWISRILIDWDELYALLDTGEFGSCDWEQERN